MTEHWPIGAAASTMSSSPWTMQQATVYILVDDEKTPIPIEEIQLSIVCTPREEVEPAYPSSEVTSPSPMRRHSTPS